MAIGRAELVKLIDDLGEIPPDLRGELRDGIKKAAEPVLMQARANASWSSRIPAATKISQSFGSSSTGVRLVVEAKQAPHARPYEGLSGDPFRHPVYGNPNITWQPQAARPFFFRAVDQRGAEVTEAVGEIVMTVARRHGFH